MGMPIFSYHDNTVELSRKSKTMSWHHTVGPDLYRKAYDREKSIYDMDSRIFTFSDHVKKSLVRDFGIPEEKVSTVYCGANFDVAAVPAVDKAKAHEGKTVLFVGTDFVRKGGETLLQAFKTVRREVRGARLVIVGSEPKVDMEGVVVRGFINKNSAAGLAELLTLYAEASVFTMPSLFEPFGIPYVEAMFCRTACVGTNIAAIPEMITDGDNGFLVEPGDHAALAERLICLLKDRRLQAAMGERGFARARQCFTWDVVAEKMVKDVQRCL
jgi:glycosyltransferase involved in cell wall biosynthesis